MVLRQQNKRIVLVHPRGSNWFPGRRDITDIANRMVPQGMLSIAAWLTRDGHDVFVYDCLGPGAPVDIDRQAPGHSGIRSANRRLFRHHVVVPRRGRMRKRSKTRSPILSPSAAACMYRPCAKFFWQIIRFRLSGGG